jgi:hypothetical protein
MDCDDMELVGRYHQVFKKYVDISPKLASMLEEFGRTKNELQILIVEIKKRNINLSDDR